MRRAQEYLVPNGRAWIAPTHLGFQAAGASIALGRSALHPREHGMEKYAR